MVKRMNGRVATKKLDALRAQGVEPFGVAFEPDGTIAEVREKFAEGEILRAAGRITAHREWAKPLPRSS
jgi:lysyl-tRNA synthetase class II